MAAIAKAHDEWVNEHLAGVSSEFDPAAYPKPGSDYNQHNLDVDASGKVEDELVAKVEAVFGGPMVAAADWDPKEHPRGPDGKFIEDGQPNAVSVKPKFTHKLTPGKLKVGQYVNDGSDEYLKKTPRKIVSIEKMGGKGGEGPVFYRLGYADGKFGTFTHNEKVFVYDEPEPAKKSVTPQDIVALQKKISETSVLKSIAYMKDEKYEAQTLHEQLMQLEQQLEDMKAAAKKDLDAPTVPPPPALAPMPKAKGGQPITAWTKTIYSGKYADGEIVAVRNDGLSERISWDEGAKKFIWQKENVLGGWTSGIPLTKKDAYAQFKGEKKSWLTPTPGAMAIDDAPPPNFDFGEVAPTSSAPSAQAAIASGDFSSLKQVGAQAGSTSGGFFEAPDGSRWYVKSQKSEKHAKNEALAAALYNAAGVEVPVVIRGNGTPGLAGAHHTATRIIDGATPNLKQKLNDPEYLAKIREGFVVDAWLANWDTAGLVFDNIVEGGDGEPKRIDVGGSLVFRAMGDEKGALFGPTVGELTTLRDPHMAPTASKVFGGISDGELAFSASKLSAITPFQIRELVKQHGMDPSVADVLIDRRQDIFSKITPSAQKPVVKAAPKPTGPKTSPEFTILPADQRGQSGDGHFAPKIWGKYGAAGVMMRHVDENGVARFLLVKANTYNSKRWQLPGGALEELETPEQGAAREVHEELGFTQEFLHYMTPIGTHKVTVDVPDKGQWSYSNIAVDVPSRPDLVWDESELGGAQWLTADEIAAMAANDEIHPALKSNLDKILAKYPDPAPKPDPEPAVVPEPAPVAAQPAPVISKESTGKTTKWTKGKFNTTVASKTSYANGEIVGMVDFDGMFTARVVWESGKFRWYKHQYDKGWQYDGTWSTKKNALSSLKGLDFYRPPAGTMMATNKDYIPGNMLATGDNVISVNDSTEPDVLSSLIDNVSTFVPDTFGKLVTKPWDSTGKPHANYKTSMVVHSDGEHIGAIHEKADGTWIAAGAAGRAQYLKVNDYYTKIDALQAMHFADEAYRAANAAATAPVKPATNPKTKKTPKLTAAQIEKQNGVLPKTLKDMQKTVFLKNLMKDGPLGYISSYEPDSQKVFTALVWAVGQHNKDQSPKLNLLQGLNILDQAYGSTQKHKVVSWLQTSQGKSLAPLITAVGGVGDVGGDVTPPIGVPSPYSIGKPKKTHPTEFRQRSLSDWIDIHGKMIQNNPHSPNDIATITEYISSSDDMNETLRGKKTMTPWRLAGIKTLQEAMRPMPEAAVVWRGTDGLGSAINSQTIKSIDDLKKFEGAIVGDPSFLSTSFTPDAAFSSRFKLIINLPQGTPALLAYRYASGSYEHEKEVLLAAGLQFKIDRVEKVNDYGFYNLYLTVVPEVKKK